MALLRHSQFYANASRAAGIMRDWLCGSLLPANDNS